MPAKLLRKKRHEKTLPLLPVSNVLKFEMVKSMQNGGNRWKPPFRSKYVGGLAISRKSCVDWWFEIVRILQLGTLLHHCG